MVSATAGLNEQIEKARQRGEQENVIEPRAVRAWYNSEARKIGIELRTGVEISVPYQYLQGLETATPEQLAQVEILGGGFGLHWEELDADLTVPGIVSGIYGTQAWMETLNKV